MWLLAWLPYMLHTHTHTHTYARARTHTHTHTHIHMHTYSRAPCGHGGGIGRRVLNRKDTSTMLTPVHTIHTQHTCIQVRTWKDALTLTSKPKTLNPIQVRSWKDTLILLLWDEAMLITGLLHSLCAHTWYGWTMEAASCGCLIMVCTLSHLHACIVHQHMHSFDTARSTPRHARFLVGHLARPFACSFIFSHSFLCRV